MMDTCHRYCTDTVADPDLTTRGGLVIPAIRGAGGEGVSKKTFALWGQFGLKIRGEAQAPPLNPQLLYGTDMRGEG